MQALQRVSGCTGGASMVIFWRVTGWINDTLYECRRMPPPCSLRRAPYFKSPLMGCPAAAICTLIWCVRPVSGLIRIKSYRSPFPHVYKRYFPALLKQVLCKKNIGQYANGLPYIPQKYREHSGLSIGSVFIRKHKKPLSAQLLLKRLLPIQLPVAS